MGGTKYEITNQTGIDHMNIYIFIYIYNIFIYMYIYITYYIYESYVKSYSWCLRYLEIAWAVPEMMISQLGSWDPDIFFGKINTFWNQKADTSPRGCPLAALSFQPQSTWTRRWKTCPCIESHRSSRGGQWTRLTKIEHNPVFRIGILAICRNITRVRNKVDKLDRANFS
jgi:hypothetical protein